MSKLVLPTRDKEFEPAPAGLHPAVCVDIIDVGYQKDPWGNVKPQIRICWQIDKRRDPDEDGARKRFLVSCFYTLSLFGGGPGMNTAKLREHLESWLGRPLDDDKIEEAGGIDLDRMVGKPCALTIFGFGTFWRYGWNASAWNVVVRRAAVVSVTISAVK